MFNSNNGSKQWSTITDDQVVFYDQPKEQPQISYDQMKEIEEHTDHNFSNMQLASAITNDLANEAQETFDGIDSVFTNIGEGIKKGSQLMRYLPALLLVGGGIYVYKKAAHG